MTWRNGDGGGRWRRKRRRDGAHFEKELIPKFWEEATDLQLSLSLTTTMRNLHRLPFLLQQKRRRNAPNLFSIFHEKRGWLECAETAP